MMQIRVKRAYVPYEKSDGVRILVDRLWPRGISKEKAHLTQWMREIAPSNELRKEFSHDPEHWEEFKKRYYAELQNNPLVSELQKLCEKEIVTFVYSAKNEKLNNAVALQEYLMAK